MRVLSWRAACFLSPRMSLSFSSRGSFMKGSLSSPKVRLAVAALALCAQSACGSVPQTRSIYKTPGITPAQWDRISDECRYEAEKATASANTRSQPFTVAYRRFELYNMCLKLKGVTYVGGITMPDEKWKPIFERCTAEAKSAVSRRPASHQRDELQEDLAVECFKREGVVFRQ
jgi:hypothetical protein